MVERKSPVHEEDACSVTGCSNKAERSISKDEVLEAGLEIDESIKRAHLCKDHYKQYKKGSKLERKIGNMGH